jgi:hypothetical protein
MQRLQSTSKYFQKAAISFQLGQYSWASTATVRATFIAVVQILSLKAAENLNEKEVKAYVMGSNSYVCENLTTLKKNKLRFIKNIQEKCILTKKEIHITFK